MTELTAQPIMVTQLLLCSIGSMNLYWINQTFNEPLTIQFLLCQRFELPVTIKVGKFTQKNQSHRMDPDPGYIILNLLKKIITEYILDSLWND